MPDPRPDLPAATTDGSARRAALDGHAPPGGGDSVSYRSRGRLLLLGCEAAVLDTLTHVPETLDLHVLLTDGDGTGLSHPDVGGLGARAMRGRPRSLDGHLGAFRLTVAGRDGETDLGAGFGLDADQPFDLVLDLDDPPLLRRQLDPPGYFRPGASGDVAAALAAAAGLVGEFEKPRYFDYDPDICVHGNRGQPGCGSCSTACPTGAIRYARPSAEDLLERVRGLLRDYREAGGTRPLVLFHDDEQGAATVAAAAADLPESVLPLELEHAGSVGIDAWFTALAYGASRVLTLLPAGLPPLEQSTTRAQIGIAHTVLQGLGLPPDRIAALEPGDTVESLADDAQPPAGEPATFVAAGDKRQVVRKALLHLHAAAGLPDAVIPLPAGAPWGEVVVDRDACTLCMACVSVCPTQALIGGGEQPLLSFREDRCVQCGLCERSCPEDAITLAPRLDFTALAEPEARVRNEEEPHYCPACGKPFATRKLIERMQRRLGEHWMFGDAEARRRLELCADCRIESVMRDEGSINPYREK